MKSKNKSYGFPYNYSNQKPLHKFINGTTNIEMLFYKDGTKYALLEKRNGTQQRVLLDEVSFNNMLGFLDRNGWNETPA